MLKKLLLLPIVLFPYLLLIEFIVVYIEELNGIETVYNENALSYFGIYLLLSYLIAIGMIIYNIKKQVSYNEILKTVRLIKLIQIPAYIFTFFVGVICFISMFLMFFSIILFVYDCLCIGLTGLLAFSGIYNAYKKEKLSFTEWIIYLITQFIFTIDVISIIILNEKIKKETKTIRNVGD